MHTRLFGVVIAAGILTVPTSSFAQVVITEVMYDLAEGPDSGREWIEVYNVGSAAVTLSDWSVFENGKSHKITAAAGGAALAPAAYAVIADNAQKFGTEHPAFAGQLFDSVFSLNNDGESIALRDKAGSEIDSIMYANSMGGNGTGDSLQKIEPAPGTAFSAGIPTPGAGAPAGGLVRTPPKEKKAATKKASSKSVKSAPAVGDSGPAIIGNADTSSDASARSQAASAAIADEPRRTPLWWLGTAAIAGIGAAGVGLARRARKTEWDIIEETP
ncbi:hypothetical protein A2765_00365 [Candidatus Kaiserbacteria bacterium RIFCSPHIGHO2_01_FULL_56_24]|uniref:LTD domain-containing protein n=1 Tax=Candidatus Kaiserbacteria bacterium RIFCSPHIGHO2_01_FULL_56_24 TaxID=1798487 RepID=A0A1F6DBV5_9BACT|nr:MAG: hypothetical protein A2765_00365 [Candidatus Kaiserbacteria bacterium RIFCSPHIGHO2_01_FULL_56_24]